MEKQVELRADGSMVGQTFSGPSYTGEHPKPIIGITTYSEYRKMVNEYSKKGFHLGDLSWEEWDWYCKGSGDFEGFSSHEIILER